MANGSTILVPLDGSELAERALGVAPSLASASGATLKLLTAAQTTEAEQEARRYLEKVASDLPIPATIHVVVDDARPGSIIIREAAAPPGTVICMTTHGRSGLARALLGSVTEEVIRQVPAPTWLVGPRYDATREPPITRIVVLTDGSTASDAIVPEATTWAGRLGARITVVTAITPEIARQMPPGDTREEAHVARLSAEAIRDGADWEVLHGDDPATAIAGYVNALPGVAAAMCTHGRSGLARLVMGSVAMRLAHELTCPILVFRPAHLLPS